ncbi:MAG: polysaccharide deacetylase family protein [Candidatus Coatesbacteria bacterium]|nr:MAG: polysaccharide deacetylase family protein [Candidatus Coatesbacteria bacterium]
MIKRVICAYLVAAGGASAGTLDTLSTYDELAPPVPLDELVVLDAFSTATEFVAFTTPATTMDAWAAPEDVRGNAVIADDELGFFDALAVAGDEIVSYRPYLPFTGGHGYGDKRVVVLMYHRFDPTPSSKYEVSVDDFKWQMDYIETSGYEVISLPRFVEALHANNADLVPDHSVIITIDDGYECTGRVAWPILREHGFPFTICLYTNYINVGGRSMTWDGLRELASDPLVTVASHSVSHPNLARKSRKSSSGYKAWLWQEIGGSKAILENALDVDVDYFCWPYGSYNSECVNVGVAAGYKGLLTVNAGKNTMYSSPYAIRRYGVYSSAPRSIFAKIILGKATYEEEYYFEYAGDAAEEYLIP